MPCSCFLFSNDFHGGKIKEGRGKGGRERGRGKEEVGEGIRQMGVPELGRVLPPTHCQPIPLSHSLIFLTPTFLYFI
jgi:hypothetical protein